MDERPLRAEELRDEHVLVVREVREHGEHEPPLWVAPPGSLRMITGDQGDDVRELAVLLQEEAVLGERGEDSSRGARDLGAHGHWPDCRAGCTRGEGGAPSARAPSP